MDQLTEGPSAVGAGVSGVAPAPELSVIVPAYNERDNVPLVVDLLRRTLQGVSWEVIFVDDNSPDGTAAAVRAIGATDDRVRCIRRIGRRGLAGACIEGILSSQARYVAILDADMQHDETLLVPMLERLRKGDVDVVVGSRYIPGGSADSFTSKRRFMSRLSHVAAHMITKVDLSDSGSGFFMIRREAVEALAPRLSSQGFKLLLDIMTTARGTLRPAELPYTFRQRQHGESKLDAHIILDFAALLVAKLTNDAISFRFLMFCFVGLTGVVIHMIALRLAIQCDPLRDRPGDRDRGRGVLELRPQQHADLPRPAPDRLALRDRAAAVSAHLRGRRGLECRRRRLALRLRRELVARRPGRCGDERGVELRGERHLRVAVALTGVPENHQVWGFSLQTRGARLRVDQLRPGAQNKGRVPLDSVSSAVRSRRHGCGQAAPCVDRDPEECCRRDSAAGLDLC